MGVGIIIPQIMNWYNNGFDAIVWEQVFTGLGAMGIGFFARDNNVTSIDAGAKLK